MRHGFYRRLAWTGIRQNRKLYIPYLLTCAGMVMMAYIISFLSQSPLLEDMAGGATMESMLTFGSWVMGIFSLVFLFYTHSFLFRRRKKEFGLYNILGMGKRHLARVLIWEAVLAAALSLGAGLLAGIAVSKFAELLMVRILDGNATFTLSVAPGAILHTLAWFGGIFLLILLNSLRQLHFTKPVELLRSEQAGEKPPRANWVLAVLGLALLAGAYWLAVNLEDPVAAMVFFFVAVVMVILGTYLLFMAGSVALCRVLQKNKRYYYQTRHFVSVSSMAYRMKRNGAGLASICILSTMVLVMVSSTVCLYAGLEDTIRAQNPRNISVEAYVVDPAALEGEKPEQVRKLAEQVTAEAGLAPENVLDYRQASFAGIRDGSQMEWYLSSLYTTTSPMDTSEYWQVYLIPLEDYNRITGAEASLAPGEALASTITAPYEEDTVTLNGGNTLRIQGRVEPFVRNELDALEMFPSLYLVVPDFVEQAQALQDTVGDETALNLSWYYGWDLACSDAVQLQVWENLRDASAEAELEASGEEAASYFHLYWDSAAHARQNVYGLYGGLFFLGILLGIVFLFAAVLMIYYKQVSEGYEDQSRFAIMQKVGMTRREIRRSVNSQILTVFFLPLLTAGVHLAFAFPLVYRMLSLFSVANRGLLAAVTGLCYLVFALFYVLVYRGTSQAYYAIVSGKGE